MPARPGPPALLAALFEDVSARRTLGAAALALIAAGLDPRISSPAIIDVQVAIREQPHLESLTAFIGVLTAAMLLFGGVLADAYRTRRVLEAALWLLMLGSLVSLVSVDGPVFVASRIVGAVAQGLVVPFAIAAVATSYAGRARATAIGISYAAYGLATSMPPLLLTITGPGGSDAPAYVAALAAALAALARSHAITDLPGSTAHRLAVVGRIATWALGVIALVAGLASLSSGAQGLDIAMIVGGAVLLGISLARERRAPRRRAALNVDLRPVNVVLAAGLFIGLAQTVPTSILPVYFQVILGMGPIFAVAAIAPLIVALVIAGPLAGWLLARVSPPWLIGGGMIAVGIGNLLLALSAGVGTGYLAFIVPFVIIGAGFAISTTVRTAVIFASVPHDLPASAAALNEASVNLGSRIGIGIGSVLLANVALASYAGSLPPGADVASATAPLRDLLVALGTPNFAAVVQGADPDRLHVYAAAYVDGIRAVHVVSGLLAVVAGILAALSLGRRRRLTGQFQHER